MQTNSSAGRQDGIQALRALACFLVLFQHAMYFTCDAKGLDYHNYLRIDFGQIGVGLFFVISGYVMGGCMGQGKRFLWNRAIRIFPPFWFAIALSWLIFLHDGPGWYVDWRSITLLPSSNLNTSYRIPYWTLCYEMAFYCVTYALILLKASTRQVQVFGLLWLISIAIFGVYHHAQSADPLADWMFMAQPGWWILLSPYSIFFVFGLFVSTSRVDSIARVPTSLLVLLGVAVWCIAINVKFTSPAANFVVLAFSYCCALIASSRTKFHHLAARLGDFSYGTYLIHIAVIVSVEELIRPHAAQIRFSLVWAILMASGATIGILYGWIEYKVHTRFLKRLFRRRDAPHTGDGILILDN